MAALENLMPNLEAGPATKHVTISISGFLSQCTDKAHEWAKLTEHA